jgi:hypothetical protein
MDYNVSILLVLILTTISLSEGEFFIEEEHTLDGDLQKPDVYILVIIHKFTSFKIIKSNIVSQ